jgi:prepilin-type N-terminal cleavage/methylation domain-containing protein
LKRPTLHLFGLVMNHNLGKHSQRAVCGRSSRRSDRGGYTLMEMLLVLTVVAVIVAVAWPNIMRMSGQQKLTEAAEKVRSVAASARVHAIESGLVYQFRYEPGGRHFLTVPFEREFESVSPNARGTGTALGRFSKASGVLPTGVTFAAPTLTGTGSSNAAATMIGTGQKLPPTALEGLPDAGNLGSLSWSGRMQFQPDGSSTDMSVDLVDKHNQRITLRIRGVTGSIGVSRLHQGERR